MKRAATLFRSLAFGAISALATAAPATPDNVGEGNQSPRHTVVWISIDGVRPDYLDRAPTPFLDELIREGVSTRQFVPVFPSLTFPSHVSIATGTTPAEHGIPGNSFIDRRDWRVHRYPWQASLLEAEPIWNTATRQGIRTAVYDWPLSHAQQGEHVAAYHGQRFIRAMSDAERLDLLLDAWRRDQRAIADATRPASPLQLLMGYVTGPDSPGHEFGPDAPEPPARLAETDALLRAFHNEAYELWRRTSAPGDAYFLFITTDHGMGSVHTLVHPDRLASLRHDTTVEVITGGNIAHYFIRDDRREINRDQLQSLLVERIRRHEFARAYRRNDLPDAWDYAHPHRTGDVVAVLDAGFTYSRRPEGLLGDAETLGGPRGMHGYDPAGNDDMLGILIIQRFPEPIGRQGLGRVHALQLHATVAALLGIEPAEQARRDTLNFLQHE